MASPLMPQSAEDDQSAALDLAALLGSRLCHDLISPLGAIGNGVELLAMSGAGGSPELQLISESVTAANARIKFFRVAFGQAAAEQRMGEAEIRGLLAEVGRAGRLSLHWEAAGDQSRRAVKRAFLALLCLETALPWGGEARFVQGASGWEITGQGKRVKSDPALWAVLGGAAGPVTPAQVHFALLAREIGGPVRWEIDETSVRIGY